MSISMQSTKAEMFRYIKEETVHIDKYNKLKTKHEMKTKELEDLKAHPDILSETIREKDNIIARQEENFKQAITKYELEAKEAIEAIKKRMNVDVSVLRMELENKENLLLDSYKVIQALKTNAQANNNSVVILADAFCASLFNVEEEEE